MKPKSFNFILIPICHLNVLKTLSLRFDKPCVLACQNFREARCRAHF